MASRIPETPSWCFLVFNLLKYGIIGYMIKKQVEFPLIDEYKKHFEITDKTIFALGEDIYTDYDLTPDLLIHEQTHLKQQERVGVKEWVYDFLYIPEKRLEYEVEAYREQLKSINDRNHRAKIRIESAQTLSSGLYGNIIDYESALQKLK